MYLATIFFFLFLLASPPLEASLGCSPWFRRQLSKVGLVAKNKKIAVEIEVEVAEFPEVLSLIEPTEEFFRLPEFQSLNRTSWEKLTLEKQWESIQKVEGHLPFLFQYFRSKPALEVTIPHWPEFAKGVTFRGRKMTPGKTYTIDTTEFLQAELQFSTKEKSGLELHFRSDEDIDSLLLTIRKFFRLQDKNMAYRSGTTDLPLMSLHVHDPHALPEKAIRRLKQNGEAPEKVAQMLALRHQVLENAMIFENFYYYDFLPVQSGLIGFMDDKKAALSFEYYLGLMQGKKANAHPSLKYQNVGIRDADTYVSEEAEDTLAEYGLSGWEYRFLNLYSVHHDRYAVMVSAVREKNAGSRQDPLWQSLDRVINGKRKELSKKGATLVQENWWVLPPEKLLQRLRESDDPNVQKFYPRMAKVIGKLDVANSEKNAKSYNVINLINFPWEEHILIHANPEMRQKIRTARLKANKLIPSTIASLDEDITQMVLVRAVRRFLDQSGLRDYFYSMVVD